jgi:thiol-disulfide isomerase/thioredoxin
MLVLFLAACGGKSATSGQPSLASVQGHWAVINYWAEWCKPCIKEIPELNLLAQEYPKIKVLGVNFDGASGDELERQVEQLGISFPTLATDPSAELGTSRPMVLPTTLILAPDGTLKDTLVGPQTLESLLAASLHSTTGRTE